MKTNKNGVKLLAAIMVFAMAFAGAFILVDNNESFANVAGDTGEGSGSSSWDLIKDIEDKGTYTAEKDITIDTAVTIDKSVTIDLGVYKIIMTSDGSITVNDGKTVTIKNSSTSKAGLIYYDYGSKIVLNKGSALTIEQNMNSVSALVNEKGNEGDAKGPLTIEMTSATLTFSKDVSTQALYIKATDSTINASALKTKTLGGVYLDLTNTNVTVGKLFIYAADLKGTSTVTATSTEVYAGATAPSTVLVGVETTFETNTVGIADGATLNAGAISKYNGGTAVVNFSGAGKISGNATLDATGYKFVGTTYNGILTSITKDATNTATFSNIKAGTGDGLVIKEGSIYIDGEIQEAQNGKITVSSGKIAIADEGTEIPKGVTLVIDEGAELTGTTVVNNGTIEAYGTVTITTLTNNGKMVITPESDFNAEIADGSTGSIVQNTEMSKPLYLGGELEYSMTIGNATLSDDFRIPEGMTLTVNGNLCLNGNSLVIDGELVINKNANIYDITDNGKIVIGKGTVSNSGIIGNAKAISVYFKNDEAGNEAVKMQGVSGVSFETKKIGNDDKIIVSGDVGRISAVEKNELTIVNAYIGDLTVAKNVTLIVGDDAKTVSGATVVIDGKLNAATDASDATITLGMNAGFTLNGTTDGKVTVAVQVGELADNTTFKEGAEETTIIAGNNVKGFTIYTKKVAVTDEDNKTSYFMRAYINGAVDKAVTPEEDKTSENITIDGEFYVASGETLSFSKDVDLTSLTGTSFMVNVQGTVTFDVEDVTKDVLKGKYVGAMYSVTVKDGATVKSETLYYTTFDAAIAAIADADDMKITSTVEKIEADFTVAADQTVEFVGVGTTVSSKATVTVETDGTVKGIKLVEGMVVVKDGATCTIPTDGYAAKTVSEDNTVTYAGLKIAIENAQAGDTVTISSGSTTESLTIPAGVKVIVKEGLKVGGNLTVSADAELVVKGTLTMNSDKENTVDVIGTLDVFEGTYVPNEKTVLKSTGTTILTDVTDVEFNGAYYNNDGKYIITSVPKAVDAASLAEIDKVIVRGNVSDSTEITLKDMTLAFDESANAKLGTVNLDNAKINATGAKVSATVVGLNGDGDKAVSSSVRMNESAVTVEQRSTVKADESVSNSFTISGMDGIAVASGKVNMTDTATAVGGDKKFAVDAGATFVIDKEISITTGDFVVDGTVVVSGAKLTLNNEKAVINGTVEIVKGGEVDLQNAVIRGTIDVKTETDKDNKLTVKDGFAFGECIKSVGANAAIIGNVYFDNYIIAYPGFDLSQAVFNKDADGKSTGVSTTYTINGTEYATVISKENNMTAINSVITVDMLKDVQGIVIPEDLRDTTDVEWTDADGNDVGSGYIGSIESVNAEFDYAKQKVTVSVGTGISLYIDGVKYTSGSEPKLTVGEHKVSATVNPGYKGTVDIMVNGVKITSGVFSIEVGKDVVVSAVGEISIDNGNTPASSSSDDGMGITDYLLIVLVVLAAILVVIVALRMMRS